MDGALQQQQQQQQQQPVVVSPAMMSAVEVHPWLGVPLDWSHPVMSVEYATVVQTMYALAGATKERFPGCVPSAWSVQLAVQLAMGSNHWVCCVPHGGTRVLLCVVSLNAYVIMERPWRDSAYFVWNATRLFPLLARHDGTLLDGYLFGDHLYLRDATCVDRTLMRSAPLSARLKAVRSCVEGEQLASVCRYLPIDRIGSLLAEGNEQHAYVLQFISESHSYRLGTNSQLLEWVPRQLFVFRVQRQDLGDLKKPEALPAIAGDVDAKKKRKKKKKDQEKKSFFQLQKFDCDKGHYRVHDWISCIDARYDHIDGRVCSFWWNPEGHTFAPDGVTGVVHRHEGGWELHAVSSQHMPDDVATVKKLAARLHDKKVTTPLSAVVHSMEQLTL